MKALKCFLGFIKWLLEHGVFPLLVLYFVIKFINPPLLPDINSTIIFNTGQLNNQFESPFNIDYQIDETAWLRASINNDGNNYAEDLEVQLMLQDNEILNIKEIYIPKFLDKKVKETTKRKNSFYQTLSRFPAQSNIEYIFHLKKLLKSSDEFDFSVCSSSKNWMKSISINPAKYSILKELHLKIVYAENKLLGDKNKSIKRTPKMSIGGYDPLFMSNKIFILLQKKDLISKSNAIEIKKIIESYKEGRLFGGINLIKLNELIINKLLSTKNITKEQAGHIIEKSKNAGGVLIGGYNIIILEIEILNTLYKNKKITIEEGQKIIDLAKTPKKGI